ncbi:MAG TPA: hypothetical protein VGA67_01950 [Candidatus Dojkabacteria bacterium]
MRNNVNIPDFFPKHLFWDVDYEKLSIENDKNFIIPRALYVTTKDSFEADISNLESIYNEQEILRVLKETREMISNAVCEMVADRYHVKRFHRFIQ